MKDIFTIRFNEALNNASISQTELANKIGVQKQCVTEYKNGRTFPSLQTLRLICKELDVSSDYLLGLKEY